MNALAFSIDVLRHAFFCRGLRVIGSIACLSALPSVPAQEPASSPAQAAANPDLQASGESTKAAETSTATPAAQETPATATKEGHSVHGEVFNEGPRQNAYLMEGVGRVRFPVTTQNVEVQKFIEQGVAQLHGFWYFESERSFRQAAMLDPECGTAYWGMAMSNRGNEKRAKGFIAEAVKRKDKMSRREKLLIESLDRYLNAKSEKEEEKKSRSNRYVADLEDVLLEFPDDLETKAFLCEFFWSAKREGLDMPSYLAVDALLTEILNAEPLHPAHHYRIHLWDGKKPELAVKSSALCGMSAPAIAHMWHMPGHIYSRLHRYHDAVYQQEASARVDHKHMMTDRIMPDQIHNFAHNNEWCIRNMISIGRALDAESLAMNMISLPRHPKYNHVGKSGSFRYGRERLIDVLQSFELYDRLAALRGTKWMEDTGNAEEDLRRDRATGAAFAALGRVTEATEYVTKIQSLLDAEKKKQADAVAEAEKKAVEAKSDEKASEKAKKDAAGKFDGDIRRHQKALD
ncbi:MAG: cell envelope integrity protein TolA, partial [Planctomycetota bacterium]